MSDLKFQLRLTLSEEAALVARNNPDDAAISSLINILNRHDAVLKCQFDAFAGYVSEAEANGTQNYPLYEWTKKTVDDPTKKAKYTKSFALYVGDKEVYEKDKADALEAELKPLVGGSIVEKMFKYDSDPAHNPQPPRLGYIIHNRSELRAGCHTAPSSRSGEGPRAVWGSPPFDRAVFARLVQTAPHTVDIEVLGVNRRTGLLPPGLV
jgi:hypothetical protein